VLDSGTQAAHVVIELANSLDVLERRSDSAVRGILAQLDVNRVALQLLLQLLRRAGRHDLAAVENRQLRGEPVGFLEIVGGEQNGQPLLVSEALDLLPHLGSDLWVEASSGLVEEEDLRPVNQCGGDVEPALHAARVVAGDSLGRVREPELLEQLVDALLQLAPVDRANQTLQAQVLAPVQVDVDAGDLTDDADRLAHLPGMRDDVDTGHTNRARGGEGERACDLDRRGLAGAVRPEKTEDRAGRNNKVNAVEGSDRALVDLD